MTGRGDVDAVLAAIDGALADHAVSGDAMRWTPTPPVEEPVRPQTRYLSDREWLVYQMARGLAVPPAIHGLSPVIDAGPVMSEALRTAATPTVPPSDVELRRRLAAGLDVPEWVVGLGAPPAPPRWGSRAWLRRQLRLPRGLRRWAPWR